MIPALPGCSANWSGWTSSPANQKNGSSLFRVRGFEIGLNLTKMGCIRLHESVGHTMQLQIAIAAKMLYSFSHLF
jgi:hypothetical protein